MLKGQSPDVVELNPLNLGIVYRYLSKFAAQNGISVEALLNNSKNSELLKTALGNFDNVVDWIKGWEEKPSQDVQKDLLKLYNGDEVADVPQENLDVVKSFVDYISEETDIHYEDLLNDTTYADTLKDAAVQFGKTAVFFSATAHFTTAGMMENASQMFNGTNYKAYGMTKSEVKSFKKEMEKLAKERNTTTDELLTESKYADDVKEALKKSKSAEGVGRIFKNAKSKVSQNVARNLYNINVSSKITPVTEDNPLVED